MVDNNFKKDYESSMDSSFYIPFGKQGHPTSAFSPNQVAEFGLRLNAGLKNIEAGPVEGRVFEQIPKQHYEEMRRLAKLAEANPSFHAPLVDPAGFQQGQYREGQREQIESQLKDVITRARMMDPENGEPIRVNMHSSNDAMGFIYSKEKGLEFGKKEGDKGFQDNYIKGLGFVDQQTGRTDFLPAEEKFYGEQTPGVKKYVNPRDKLKEENERVWERTKLAIRSRDYERQLIQDRLNAHKTLLMGAVDYQEKPLETIDLPKLKDVEVDASVFSRVSSKKTDEIAKNYINLKAEAKANEETLLTQSRRIFEDYLKFYKPKEENKQRELDELKGQYNNLMSNLQQQEEIEKRYERERKERIKFISDPIERYRITDEIENKKLNELKNNQIKPITHEDFANLIDLTDTPEIYKPIDEFALDKSAKTFSNVAFHAIEQAKGNYKKAPVITIENWSPEMPFSRGESLKQLVEESRKELAQKLQKEKGYTETEAKRAAEAVLGATWDVGHIYQLKKYGFDEKDVIAETEKIAPYLKHVHLTDNFGYSDSHLALGMGTVPIKQMLEKIKEAGYKDKYIIEAGAFAGEFKTSPVLYSAEELNSPVYTYYDKGSTWQATRDIYQSYFPGFGDILPETHFRQLYGSGFSQLPKELGGPQQGDRSRFSGNPLT